MTTEIYIQSTSSITTLGKQHGGIWIVENGVSTIINGKSSDLLSTQLGLDPSMFDPDDTAFGDLAVLIATDQPAPDQNAIEYFNLNKLDLTSTEAAAAASTIETRLTQMGSAYEITYNGNTFQVIDTDIRYSPLGVNSNSLENTLVGSIGIDFRDLEIFEDGDSSLKQYTPYDYPAINGYIDGIGDETTTIYDENTYGHNVLVDREGEDTIILKSGADVVITKDSDATTSNTLVLEGLDESDIDLVRSGDSLLVYDVRGASIKLIASLKDFFDGNDRGTSSIEFADDGNGNGGDGGPIDLENLDSQDLTSLLRLVDDWLVDVLDKMHLAHINGSPLIFDLSGNDAIDLISLTNSTTYWDIDQDGFAEASGWVDSGDGLLAIDLNDNGQIDDNGELFGTVDTDGFTILAQYDSNGDGEITAQDAVWDDLIVWQDANENGYSESDELKTLGEWDIVSIDLDATEVSQTNQGHDVTHTSTFTIDDGVNPADTRIVHDVWFQYDDANTIYKDAYDLDASALFLPTLRGYGELPALHIAESLDNTGTGNLLDLVSDFASQSFDDLFDDTSTLMDDVRDIMYRWAGIDGLSGDERGSNIDSRELGFLEKLSGQDFLQRGHWENPFTLAAQDLQEAFDIAQQNIFARLVAQSAGGELFTGDWYYDIASDSIQGVTGLDSTVLSALETEASSATYPEVLWGNVVRMIEYTVGTSNLPTGDQTALDTAITNSSASLDLQDILDSLLWGAPDGTTYTGTSGDDSLTGGSGYDTLNGGYGNDTLHGGIGNDDLRGDADDDALYGDTGNDYITGGTGNDTYYYDLGDGEDVYKENGTGTGNADEIVLGSGIDSGDLTITRAGNTDLMIEIDTGTATGLIVIENQFNYSTGGGHIETIRFSDNSTYNLAAQDYTLTGTSGNDTLYGSRYASTGVDTIYGGAGNDTIYGNAPNEGDTAADTLYGEAGNDTLKGSGGNDTLYGGTGDDTLYGGSGDDDLSGDAGDDELHDVSGDDTYHYLGGNDTIYDGNGTDEILLDATWNSVTPSYYKIGNDLQIYWDADNSITIDKFFTTGEVETMVYADTTSVTLGSVSYVVQGTDGNDSITGTTGDDLFYGFAGDDTLNGSLGSNGDDTLFGGTGDDALNGGYGDDYLDGGAGDDTMKGGADNDHYIYASGDDWIRDLSGTDVLELVSGWTIDDITLSRYDTAAKNLVIEINGANSITVEKQFYSTGNIETLRLNDGTSDITLASAQVTTYGTASGDSISGILSGASEDDIMYGLDGNDTMNGKDGADVLYGDAGNDTVDGDGGNDTLYGGAGDDTYRGDGGDDLFVYESGLDTMYENSSGNDTLWITGGTTVNDITFSNVGSYDTKIVITASTDEITLDNQRYSSAYHFENLVFDDGFETDQLENYSSWLWGTSGNDMVAGNANDNVLIGLAGNDTLDADAGNDDLHGGAGTDTLYGDAGDDLLHGGTGDDALYGGAGTDILYGGDGADVFYFESGLISETDSIKDFSTAEGDALDISDILTGYDPQTDDITQWVQITDNGTDSTLAVDANGGADNFVTIATITGVTGLTDEAALETAGYLIAA